MNQKDKRAIVLLVAGFSVWSAAFVLLYALQALGCAYGWSQHRAILIVAFVLVLLPLIWLALQGKQKTSGPSTTLSVAALWANRAALAAAVLVFLPVTFATTCL